MSNELIKVTSNNERLTVLGRDLHKFLEVSEKYTDWMTRLVKKYDFVEGEDFALISEKSDKTNKGRPSKEYQLTLDIAKEISMVSNTEKGKQARKYFIECENKLTTKPQLSMAEYLVAQAQQMLKIELEQTELKNRLAIVEAKQTNSPTDFYSVVAWCNLRHKKVTLREAQIYGRACSNLSSKLGVQTCSTPDPRFGIVKTYHADVLDEIVG